MPLTRRPLQGLLGLSLALPFAFAAPLACAAAVPPAAVPVLDRISAASMRGNLSFLASDALEGRGTPSGGLDIAAEFIASQFRGAGLEPLGDDGYFQTADWNLIDPKRSKKEVGKTATPPQAPVKVRNVVGILRGSDPVLKDTYVLVTAHYDHVGLKPGQGDGIFNGANDDGSGTVSVIELAKAFAAQTVRTKRSIVFMTTVSVAYAFPDYHGAGDHRAKIDYENMAAVDRTVALAIWKIANGKDAPKWNVQNPKAAKYLGIWQQRGMK